MKTSIIVLFFAFIVSGCVSPGKTTSNLIKADNHTVKNEKYFEKESGAVWDVLVKELSKSFFMINNIDKESRIINVSYSSNDVCDYVDCGGVHVVVQKSSLNKMGRSSYDFGICESNSYITEGSIPNPGGLESLIICKNSRRPKLEGRMNIYVAPEGNGTLVTVNSRYILDH